MTDLATLRRLYAQMVHLAADAFKEGNERLAAQALGAAEHIGQRIAGARDVRTRKGVI